MISLFSQSLFALGLSDAIEVTASLGYDAIELACCAPHLDLDTARSDPERVARQIAHAGLRVSTLSTFGRWTDPDTRDHELATAETYIRLAPMFGTQIVKMTPGPPASALAAAAHWQSLAFALDALVPLAQEVGVCLAFETHMRQLTDALAPSRRLLAMAPADTVGLTVDYSNLTFAGEDAGQAAAVLAPRTYNVHVKNGTIAPDGSWRFGPLDHGWTDYLSVLTALREAGYAGPLAVECLGPLSRTDPAQAARRDLGILRRYLSHVGWRTENGGIK